MNVKVMAVLKEWVIIILIALAIAVVLHMFVFDTRMVPTASMYPTIAVGDRVINEKITYLFSDPKRGDIIVFAPPPTVSSHDDLLKRVIGLPGEYVEIKNGGVYINDQLLEESYLAEKPNYTYAKVLVPEGHYFVMGDNRNSSADSHRWEDPFLPRENVKGKVVFRYWPLNRMGTVK